ncbi:Histone methylation protein [Phytophthora palmivora]|uniref:Histone-lysine N-methyltransferase, H3 lysine-79 specific n=1 Tax=Phytophthora palmivora TaxID=4796 RepID=A0A2P4YU05_9STRA|nr:Histone methylation protein [Phytophthora palmivora]
MVRTSFSFDDDKQLVQLVRRYEDAGARIVWANVVHNMRHTGQISAVKQRLRSLKRSHGNQISQFPRKTTTPPSFLPMKAEEAVASIFVAIPAKLVKTYDGHSIHRNVGEILPAGITKLLEEVDVVDGDVFVDIGAGLGNVVAQLILQTQVQRAIGIEIREDIQPAGVDAMKNSLYYLAFQERTSFICRDVTDIQLPHEFPFAYATVVYWCNILFEQKVIEKVKVQLISMSTVRILMSAVNFCPRHRKLCTNRFCSSFELAKTADVPCSWKAKLIPFYIYKAKH